MSFVDVVTSSHNHTDHLDAETLMPLMRANPAMRVVAPAANRQFAAERLGINPETILPQIGQDDQRGGIFDHGDHRRHPQVERDEQGRSKYLGYVIQAGHCTIYHSGDTLWHDAIVKKVKPFKVDMALLPINGDRPERRVAGNLDGAQAARLAKAIGARDVIPCHYDMFEFNTARRMSFCRNARQFIRPMSSSVRAAPEPSEKVMKKWRIAGINFDTCYGDNLRMALNIRMSRSLVSATRAGADGGGEKNSISLPIVFSPIPRVH